MKNIVLLIALMLICASPCFANTMELSKEKTYDALSKTAMRLNWTILDQPGLPISTELLLQYNKASMFSKENKHAEALKAWDALLSKAPEGTKYIATAEFMGKAHMRKAWVLMDMKKFADARKIFESDSLRAALMTAPQKFLFDYYMSYGNTLVLAGDKRTGDEMLAMAKKYSAK